MHSWLYTAATTGILVEVPWNEITTDDLQLQITPNGNTVLHVACQFGQRQFFEMISLRYVHEIQFQLRRTNNNGDTPLHLAAKYGCHEIVEAILQLGEAGSKLRAVNKDGDTALHMAVRWFSNEQVIEKLILADANYIYRRNEAGETPLYLATERAGAYLRNLTVLLETSKTLEYYGPSHTTAMHAAATNNENPGCLLKLLKHDTNLVYKTDALGWTPLHYAVCMGKLPYVCILLQAANSVAYVKARLDGNRTALHIASGKGFVDIMKVIIKMCPDIWEMVNSEAQNILHIAADHAEEESIKFILTQPWAKYLMNQKDNSGNTPMHLLYANNMTYILLMVPAKASYWVDNDVVNIKNLSIRDVPSRKRKKRSKNKKFPYMIGRNIIRKESEEIPIFGIGQSEKNKIKRERVRQMADTQLIVATLLATVTFAAGFTLPGGYSANGDNLNSLKVLGKKAAFRVFMVTNTTAMLLSVSAVFLYFTASLYKKGNDLYLRYKIAVYLVLIGLGAMVVAFMAALAGAHPVLEFHVVIIILGISCILLLLYILELKSMGFFGHLRDSFMLLIRTRDSRFLFSFARVPRFRQATELTFQSDSD